MGGVYVVGGVTECNPKTIQYDLMQNNFGTLAASFQER